MTQKRTSAVVCDDCGSVHGSGASVAIGRFQPDGPVGYRSRLDGAIRATRVEAERDYCAALRGASTSRGEGESAGQSDCMHLCCDYRTEPHPPHPRSPATCGFCRDETEGVCPNYPATCRRCVECRSGDHDGPCVCDCEEATDE